MTRVSLILIAVLAVGACKRPPREAPAAKTGISPAVTSPAADAATSPAPKGEAGSWKEAVQSADPKIRASALAATPVGDSGEPPELAEGLRHPNAEVRRGAIRGMLGFILKFSDASGLRQLLKLAVKDGDSKVRYEAVTSLASLSHRAVLPRLIARYRAETDPGVRQAILSLAAASGDRRALGFLRSQLNEKEPAPEVFDGLRKIETKATGALLRLLESDSPALRARAIEVLGEIGDVRTIPRLEAALGNSDLAVVRAAIDALAMIGAPSALEKVLKLCDHAAAEVRSTAVGALGRWQSAGAEVPKAVVAALLKRLAGDTDPDVRAVAAQSLGQLRLGEALTALEQATATTNPSRVRAAAVEALGRIGGVKAVPLLVSKLEDKDADIRAAAARSLGALGAQGEVGIPALTSALKRGEKNLDARAAMIRALGGLGAETATPLLETIATSDPVPYLRIEAAGALLRMGSEKGLEAIRSVLRGATDWEARREGARALELRTWQERREAAKTEKGRELAGKVAALTFEALKTEREPQVREVLYQQLGRLRGPEAAKVQREALSERVPFFRLMAAAGLCRAGDKQGCKILTKGLSAPQAEVRAEAARRIGWYRVNQAKTALKKSLADPVVFVSGAARVALARLEGNKPPKVKRQIKKL